MLISIAKIALFNKYTVIKISLKTEKKNINYRA